MLGFTPFKHPNCDVQGISAILLKGGSGRTEEFSEAGPVFWDIKIRVNAPALEFLGQMLSESIGSLLGGSWTAQAKREIGQGGWAHPANQRNPKMTSIGTTESKANKLAVENRPMHGLAFASLFSPRIKKLIQFTHTDLKNITLNNNSITIVPLDNLQTGVPYNVKTLDGKIALPENCK